MSDRFRYVDYDGPSASKSGKIRKLMAAVERAIMEELHESRPRSLALTKLEESFMWTGKAIRDAQLSQAESRELRQHQLEMVCVCGVPLKGGQYQCDKCAIFEPADEPMPEGLCQRCGEELATDDLPPDAGYCSYCDHMLNKDD